MNDRPGQGGPPNQEVGREGIDAPDAVFHSRVDLEITDEATTGSLMTKVREQLPFEFDRHFEVGSIGRMRRDD